MNIKEFAHNVELLREKLLAQAEHYLGNRDDAEDVVQESLVKLWAVRERIDDGSCMARMASVVCRNTSLNMLRDAKPLTRLDDVEPADVVSSVQEDMELHESLAVLRRGIRGLGDKYRAIIRMRNVEGMSYADIARIMGATESSVRGMACKARRELLNVINSVKS